MRSLGRLFTLLLLTPLVAPLAGAQDTGALYASDGRQPIRIAVEGVYQQFSDDGEDISEVSVPISVRFPFGNQIAVSFQTNYAAVSGSDIESVSGLGDLQAIASFFQPFGEASLTASVGVNATTGDNSLTLEQLRTSTLAGQAAYDLRIPSFGQGIRVAPAITYAFPVGERLALGAGISYQYRGPYEPIEEDPSTYDPGEEVLLTGGIDYAITATSSVALDISLGINGEDSFGTEERSQTFEPGNSIAATAQYRLEFGFDNEVRAVARYRGRGENSLPDSAADAETAVPDQFLVLTDARFEVTPQVDLGGRLRFRHYGESAVFGDALNLFDAGIVPVVRVSEQAALTARFTYTFGAFSGFTAGGGLRLAL